MPPLTMAAQLGVALAPDLLLMGGAMILLLWAAWHPETAQHQKTVGIASIVLTAIVLAAVIYASTLGHTAEPPGVARDAFRWVTDVVVLVATLCTLILSLDYNSREGMLSGEAHVLVLLAASGMMLLAAARDLILIFLGIELMSVAVYVLAGMNRRSARSAEGALKYFLLGAFSTAFLLYGIALVYGALGTTNLAEIDSRVSGMSAQAIVLLPIGVGLLLIGFGFKVAAVPFHMWAPDVYEGAPTPVTAFMAAGVKAAAFAAFLRVWIEAFGTMGGSVAWWYTPVFWLAVASMVVGNLVALAQRNIKRLLAYSSIAHAGYLLVALSTGTQLGSSAFLFYILAYTVATMGAFAVVVAVGRAGEPNLQVTDFSGLWTERPGFAVAMSIFMLALLGFPFFGGIGFWAKWSVVRAVLVSPVPGGLTLAIVLVLTSVVSSGYYLYVVLVMFMRPRPANAEPTPLVAWPTRALIGAAAIVIIAFGVFPGLVIDWTKAGALLPARYETTGSPAATATK
jgi:NADH-quinone oxidoreductase subunit N